MKINYYIYNTKNWVPHTHYIHFKSIKKIHDTLEIFFHKFIPKIQCQLKYHFLQWKLKNDYVLGDSFYPIWTHWWYPSNKYKMKKNLKNHTYEKTILVQAHMLILKLILFIHINIIHFQLFNSTTLIPRIQKFMIKPTLV